MDYIKLQQNIEACLANVVLRGLITRYQKSHTIGAIYFYDESYIYTKRLG